MYELDLLTLSVYAERKDYGTWFVSLSVCTHSLNLLLSHAQQDFLVGEVNLASLYKTANLNTDGFRQLLLTLTDKWGLMQV